MSGMARGPERRPLEAKGTPPMLSWEVPSPVCDCVFELVLSRLYSRE